MRQIGKLIPVGQQDHVSIVSVNGTPGALDRIRKGAQDAAVGKGRNGMAGIALNQIIGDNPDCRVTILAGVQYYTLV